MSYVVAAYVITGVALTAYVVSVFGRLRAAERALAALDDRAARSADDGDPTGEGDAPAAGA